MSVQIRLTQSPEDIQQCQALRRVVFVEGQGVDEALEVDGRDPDCLHLMAFEDARLVGCARMRPVDGVAKAERVAVLESYRGEGIGRQLMHVMEQAAAQRGMPRIKLAAQIQVVPFYEHIGYTAYGDEFIEAGIRHRWMSRDLNEDSAQ